MKFAKKFFVGILAIMVLVSCLTLSTSAEDLPKLPSENLEDVLEYLRYDKAFIVEKYDEADIGDYAPEESFFELVKGDASHEIVDDSEKGKSLLITNCSEVGTGYRFDLTESRDFKKLYVTSFDFKTGDSGQNNGSDFYVVATLNDYFDNIVLFAAKTADDGKKSFSYSEYDSDRVTYETVEVKDVAPELGVWYRVEIVFSTEEHSYSITVKKDGAVVFAYADEISNSEGIASLRYYVKDPKDAGTTKTFIDDVQAYEGTAIRDVANPDKAAAEFVVAIQELADYSGTSIEKQIEIADLYAKLFEEGNGYDPYYPPTEGVKYDENADLYDKAKEVADGAESYRNRTYAKAFAYYTESAVSAGNYYERIEIYNKNVKHYYDDFKNGVIEVEADDIEMVKATQETCDAFLKNVEDTAKCCTNFVEIIEEGYDALSKDYEYMLKKYGVLSSLVKYVELTPEYKYADVNSDTKYPTVADAIVVYEELEAKLDAIETNANHFKDAVGKMSIVEKALTKDNHYLTEDFMTLYNNSRDALKVYNNGTVHPQLDPATYPGLSEAIDAFDKKLAYIDARVVDCVEFVSRITGAASSPDYSTVVRQLELTKCYFDTDREFALEDFTGVKEAIALRESLEDRVKKNKSDAEAYIAKVAEINLDASYLNLKAAVDAAMALKSDGNITGITGVEEANIKLAKAEAIVSSLAGHSSTLIEAVTALKSATTLAERRYLIFVANGAKDGSEDSISGVSAAKAELAAQILKYNSEIEAMNNLFASVVGDVTGTMSSVVGSEAASNSIAVAGAVVK